MLALYPVAADTDVPAQLAHFVTDQWFVRGTRSLLRGMSRALIALRPAPEYALIDGNKLPRTLSCPARAIVQGDATEPAISAASILAKVERDRLMVLMDQEFPGYGFAQHKGYPTPDHLAALTRLGPCAEHRRSFAPVRALMAPGLFSTTS